MSTMSRLVAAAAGLPVILHGSLAAAVESRHNLPTPVTPIAREIYDLHLLMLAICCVIFVGVFSVMFYSIYAHRKSVGHKAVPFHENTTVEIVWTIIPLFILIGMAWPATKSVLALKDTSNPDITIKATGYQWKWGYDYLKGEGEGIALYSNLSTPSEQVYNRQDKGENYLLEVDQNLVVPVGRKIRVLTTAGDVIHAWWVPAFGVKQDAIPGFVRDTWFRAEKEGIYRGQCAELCGKDHGFMPIVVEVVVARRVCRLGGRPEKENRGRRGRSGQDLGPRRASHARGEGLRRELRGVSPGERHGRAERVPGARRLEDGERAAGRSARADPQRQAGYGHAGVRQAALRRRHRRRHYLHAKRLGQQGGRQPRATGRSQDRPQVTHPPRSIRK